MKRPACKLSLILACALAAPVALAGSEIVKCIDSTGHVTLTDQPCGIGMTTVRLASDPASGSPGQAAPYPLLAERDTVPPPHFARHGTARERLKARPLARDVATLKEARARFLLEISAPRAQLAGLE